MKTRLLKATSLSVALIFASWGFGQTGLQPATPQETPLDQPVERCATQLLHEQRLANDPAYALSHQQAEDYIAAHQFEKVGGQYRIPVVVHVVYYNSGLGLALYNITDNQIRDAIKKLNRQNRNLTGGQSVDVDIEYSLAVRDPSGNCTTGITRDNAQTAMTTSVYNNYVANGVAAATTTGITDAQIHAVNQWSSSQYLNIWLVPEFDNSDGGAGVQGYAALAGSHGQTWDGSVMLGIDFIDPNSTTLVHELGHSFNLYHTFQGDGTGSTCPTDAICGTSGDCCADTPKHKRSNSTCNASGTNTCEMYPNNDNILFVYNYMDYSTCPDRFTPDQVARMQATAGGTRVSFQASSGNNKLVPPNNAASVTAVRAEQTSVCLGSSIQLFDATSCSPNDYLDQATGFPGFTYSWSITNGTNTYTSTHQNPVFTPAAGTYTVTLTITHASYTGTTITSTTPNVFTVVAAPVSACTPIASAINSGETVSKVAFNTISNNSSVISNGGYQNYLCSINTSVVKGNVYPLTVNAVNNSSTYKEYVRVDIDWNNDGDFADTGEGNVLAGSNATIGGLDITGNVTIPTYAVEGVLLRMRVIGELGSTSNPITSGKLTCSTAYNYGDIEDYGIYVIPSVTCPATLSQPSASTICANANTTFSATFSNSPTSYQWQVSTNGGSTWTNLSNTAPYSNVTTATLTITAATTAISTYRYRCVGTNSCGSANSNGAILTVNAAPAAPTVSNSGATTFCAGGSVTLTSSSSTGNTWSTGATTQAITVNASGTYTVSRTVSGCASPASTAVTVTVNPVPSAPTISTSGSTTICSGSSVTLTSSAGSGNTWSNGATTPSITVSTAGTYTVTATASGCTSPASAATTVTVNSVPAAPTISNSGATTFCSGGSVTLTSSAGSGNTWSTGSTTASISVTTSGTYSVTRTVSGCTSPASAAVTVTVNPIPAAPTISNGGSTTICSGNSVTLTSSAGSGNTWSNGATTPSITISTPGTYTVTTTANGCTSPASAGTTVTVNTTPSAPTISSGGSTTFCSGGSVTLTSSAGSGNTWSNGSTTPSITVSSSGTYTVTRTSGGCTSPASAGITVTVNPTPSAPTISNGGSTTICSGNSVTLTSSAGSGNTWSNGATTPSITVSTPGTYTVTTTSGVCTSPASAGTVVTVNTTPSAPTISNGGATTFCSGGSVTLTSSAGSGNTWSNGSTSPSITVSASGTYTVTATSGGCTSPASSGVTVTVNPTPSAPTISNIGSTTFCSGGSVTLTSSAGSGNTWSDGSTSPSITVSTPGTYAVTTTSGGCTSPASAGTTVTVNPTPAIASGTLTNPSSCGATDGSIAVSGSGSGTLSWSGASSGTTNVTLPSSISSLGGGAYTITFTPTATGCVSNTLNTSLTDPAAPSAPIVTTSGSTTICQGGSVVLTSSASSGNTWSNGSTNPAITVTTPGTYTVTVTSGACTSGASVPVTVTVNAPVTPNFNTVGPYCSGSSIGALPTTSLNGITGTWTPAINNMATTTYTFTPTSGQCSNTGSTSIAVNPLPAVSFGTIPQLCVYNSPVTLTQGSPAGGTYSGAGVSGGQFNPATAGLGTVTLIYSFTDGNGCTNTAQSSVVVDACLGLDELANSSILIYPNPTSGMITISADNLTIEQVEVYDAFGKLVYEQKANKSVIENVDLTAAASGVYTIRVFTNADVKHIPVIINK